MLHLLQKMVIYDLDFFFLDFYGAAGLELLCRDYRLQVNTTTTHVLLLLFATTPLLVSITVIHFASSCIMVVTEVFYCLPAKMESFFISRFLHFVGL